MKKLLNAIVNFRKNVQSVLLLFVCNCMFVSQQVMAEIPLSDDIKEKAEDGDYFEWMQWVIDRIYVIILGVIGMCVFAYVAWGAIMAFVDWRKGKEEVGEMFAKIGIALGVLVVVSVILSIANGLVTT